VDVGLAAVLLRDEAHSLVLAEDRVVAVGELEV
jgi:hypothetical protein